MSIAAFFIFTGHTKQLSGPHAARGPPIDTSTLNRPMKLQAHPINHEITAIASIRIAHNHRPKQTTGYCASGRRIDRFFRAVRTPRWLAHFAPPTSSAPCVVDNRKDRRETPRFDSEKRECPDFFPGSKPAKQISG